MVAVVSGNGLGLFNSSLSQLGLALGGSGGLGQSKTSQVVNIATGNLVLQDQDENLAVRGFNASFLRTYNSRGTVAGAGQDGFITGYERKVVLNGTLNDPASTLTMTTGDGQCVTFTYSASNTYTSTSGDGAHDSLVWSAANSTWTFTEGSTRRQEIYDALNGGRLSQIRDFTSDGTTPAVFDVLYNGAGQVSEVRSVDGTGASADAICFDYTGTQLTGIRTREGGVDRYQVSYGYDAFGRLAWVQQDLTPLTNADNTWDAVTLANNDGKRFRTSYSYVTASASDLRIASVTQSDGTITSYTYEDDGAGSYRVKTVTLGDTNTNDADGAGETATFTYTAGQTDVADSLGRIWTYKYDANKQLTEVDAPAIAGLRDVTTYQYDASGNLTQVKAVRGSTVLSQFDYAYDANGNQTWQWDAIGNAVSRTFTTDNQLASETTYTGVDPDRTGASLPTGGLTTRYVYDSRDRLRFTVDTLGEVTEYTYATTGNGIGQRANSRQYLGATYSGTYDEASLSAWATSTQKASSTLTEYGYDAKGRLAQTTAYANVDASGNGLVDTGASIVRYAYDAQGMLLQQVTVHGATRTLAGAAPDGSEVVDYVYDGLGRLLSVLKHDSAAGSTADATSLGTTYAYVDSGNKIAVTLDTGATRTDQYNAAHRLATSTDVGLVNGSNVTRTTTNYYDAAGQLRASQDAGGARTYFFYDEKGSLSGRVDGTGAVTEFTRDGLGRVVDTIGYPTRVDTSTWLSGATVVKNWISDVRPVWSTGFDSLPVAGMDTSNVNSQPGGLTLSNGQIVFGVNTSSTTTNPVLTRNGSHALTDNVNYSAEISTGASQNNTFLLMMLDNAQSWGPNYRRAGVYFRSGVLYLHSIVGTTTTNTAIGSTQANTTYVVEARTRNGRIDFNVYVKGQAPSTGWSFGIDATPTEWAGLKLSFGGFEVPNQVGDSLYLDNVSESSLGIRHNSCTYDSAGRLATETNASNLVTTYSYDGASRLQSVSINQVGAPAANARVSRMFYDNEGRLLATLDAAGYLTENVFDNGGRLIKKTGYATLTNSAYWATGTLAQLRPAGNDADTQCRYFYDGRSRLVGQLELSGGTVASGQGYLTEYLYDEASNLRATTAHSKLLAGLTGSETLSTLHASALASPPSPARVSQRAFNGLGQLVTETNYEGTVTSYSYDEAGRLVRVSAAINGPASEVRDGYTRYDVFGNVIGQMSGEQAILAGGAALLTMTEAQLNTAYATYGTTHCYDLLGRRTDSTDNQGNKTWYFYDADGRNTFTVRGQANGVTKNALGEVIETRYDAFGQVSDTLAYTGKISIGGTQTRADVQAQINVLNYVAATDTRRQFSYDVRGLLSSSTDATGVVSNFNYTVWGELYQEIRNVGNAAAVTIQHAYDARGLETGRIEALGVTGVARTLGKTYDAFGRVTTATDALLNVTGYSYDRAGRQISISRSGGTEVSTYTYDAFDRVVTQAEPTPVGQQARTTTYSYNDQAKTVSVTSPSGVVIATAHNSFGETVSVTKAGSVTRYQYDRDGDMVRKDTQNDKYVWTDGYDHARGLLLTETDGDGRTVTYTYDAAGRVLTRTLDPTGLNLTTTYAYDGQGRQITVTDASGKVTAMSYDQEGRLVQVVKDPGTGKLNLTTTFTYDAAGHQLTVTEGAGTPAAQTTQYAYDALGRRISERVDPAGLNLTTTYAYDANGNVISKTDPLNNVTHYAYDQDNQLRFVVDATGGVTETAYDIGGRVTMTRAYAKTIVAPATWTLANIQAAIVADDNIDQAVYRIYNGDDREILRVDGTGGVHQTAYDSQGRVCMEVDFVAPVASATLASLRAGLKAGTVAASSVVGAPGSLDQVTYYWRTDDSTEVIRIDSLGQMKYTWGDATGHVLAEYSYANPLPNFATNTALKNALATGTAAYPATGEDITRDLQNCYVYDAAGRVRYKINGAGAVVGYLYDGAGRVTETDSYTSAITVSTALWNKIWFADPTAITDIAALLQPAAEKRINTYDGAGRLTQVKDALNYTTQYRYDAADDLIATVDACGNTSRSMYDAAGRKLYDVDQMGGVTRYWYDACGRVVSVARYSTALNAGSLTDATTAANITSLLSGNTAALQTYFVYDAEGQVRFTIDGLGDVTEATYDGIGRQVGTRRYSTAISLATLGATILAGTARPTDVVPTASAANDRFSYNVYDASGAVIYTVSCISATQAIATEHQHDGVGHETATILYSTAFTNAPGTILDATGVYNGIGSTGRQAAKLRQTRYAYDVAGQLRYSIDDAGGVIEKNYNALGQVTSQREYTATVTVASATVANIQSAVNGVANRLTTYTYNLDGLLKSVTDALNKTESYTYSATGHRITKTDKLGSVWTYDYDAAGNQIAERSPQVWVFRFDSAGVLQSEQKSIVTAMTYDGCGHMLTRTENAEATDVNDRRTTTFTYDARGLQTRATFAAPWVINTSGQLVSGGNSTYVETTYNALGQAVVQRDALGNYSYKVYDTIGRTAYDIDAAGYVTNFAYNAYGEQTGMTRYATKYTGTSGATPVTYTQISTGVTTSAANDRVLTFGYDQLGRKISVTQGPAAGVQYYKAAGTTANGQPQTLYTYDNYGNLTKESVLLEAGTWADTFHYYDKLGRRTMSVDAMGYVSTWGYNATGLVTSETQYARAATGTWSTTTAPSIPLVGDEDSGYDRNTTYSYDAAGRKTGETAVNRHYWLSDGTQSVRNVVTSTEYDALDNVTAVVVDGVRTETAYDLLGRATSVTEASRQALTGTAWTTSLTSSSLNSLSTAGLYTTVSPYTETAYDAFGNAVRSIRYAKGKNNGADASNDQTSVSRYDHLGRLVLERDATGVERYREYDDAGQVTKVWYRLGTGSGSTYRVVANYAYDKLGRQITNQVTRQLEVNGVLQGSVITDSSEQVRYNAFGEIVAKGTDLSLALTDSALPEQFVYDALGRMTRCNSDNGVYRDYGYDLNGRQIVEKRTVYTTGPGTSVVTIKNTYDKLGRLTRQDLPSYTSTSVTTYVTKSYDRWGNALDVVDAMGYLTSYEYNELNQVVRELTPLVKVLSEAGVETWIRPERRWYFDAVGREVGSRDANGVVRQKTYDAAGELVSERDGEGYATLHAYDGLGREVAKQDALGYITYTGYDRMNRVFEQGDFLLTTAGTARTLQASIGTAPAIMSYLYDADGNRIRATDALAHFQTYDFDSRGKILQNVNATGGVSTYAYDLRGNKIKETTPMWSSGSATTADRDGDQVRFDELSWKYDYFGNVTDHDDLGQTDSNYTYNAASGMLTGSDVSGTLGAGTTTYTYYENGLVRQMNQGTSVYKYTYDANGNRLTEESTTTDGNNMSVHVLVTSYYDSHNRVVRVTSDDLNNANVRQMDIRYDYDANGNRRRVLAQTGYQDAGNVTVTGPGAAPVVIGTPPPVGIASGQQSLQFKLVAGELFRDPDGSVLTYTAMLDDGNPLPTWLSMSTDAVTGQLVFSTKATSWTATDGIYRVRITATEAGTGTQVSTVMSVVIGNDLAPQLIPNVDVIWNIRTGIAWSQTFNAADYFVDYDLGDELSFSYVSASPSAPWLSGTTLANGLLQLSGTPSNAQAGTYTVTLKATDRKGISTTKTITIKAQVPVAPAPGTLANRNIFAGRGFVDEIPLSSLFTDANGDTLTVTAAMSDGKALPPWMSFVVDRSAATPCVRLDGSVPFGTAVGTTYAVRFTATDPGGLTNTTTLTLTVVAAVGDTTPTVTSSPITLNWTGGQNYTYSMASALNDAEGDNMYAWLARGHFETEWDPVVGDFVRSWVSEDPPDYISFNQSTRSIVGTVPALSAAENYDDLFLYVKDPSGKITNKFKITLNVAAGGTSGGGSPPGNQAPVLVKPIPNQTAVSGQTWAYLLPLDLFKDPEGQAITLAATTKPAWMTFDATTGLLRGTVPAGTSSTTVSITATDASGASTVASFTLNWASGTTTTTGTGSGTVLTAIGTTGTAATVAGAYTTQDLWYTYDKENRVVISNGGFVNGAIAMISDPSTPTSWSGTTQSMYDAVGNLVGKLSMGGTEAQITRSFYTQRGQLSVVMAPVTLHTGTWMQGTALAWTVPTERRFYDNAGRLTEIQNFIGLGDTTFTSGGTFVDDSGWMSHATTFAYDNNNQVTSQSEYGRIGQYWADAVMQQYGTAAAALVPESTDRNVLGLLSTTTTTRNLANVVTNMTYQQYNVSGYPPSGIPTAFTHTYTYTTLKSESYLENVVSGSSSNTNFKAGSTTSVYDAFGNRKKVTETSKATQVDDTLRYFSYDGSGMILTRWDGTWKNSAFYQGYTTTEQKSNRHHYIYSADNEIGNVDDLGRLDVISQLTGFTSGETGTNTVTVQAGDTLQSLAQRVYGNSSLWYVLASANGIHDDSQLVVSMSLKAPDVKTTKNDSSTFKPYNPADIIGDTTPSLTYIAPPPAAGCSFIATIVRIAVAVACAFNPLLLATPLAAAALGAGGELFAETVEISDGVRAGYDVGSIVVAGISAGVGAASGVGASGNFGTRFAMAAAQSVNNRITSFAINKALGRHDTWSWKGLAAGAVTAGLSAGIFGGSSSTPDKFRWQDAVKVAGRTIATSAISYATDKAIVGESHWSWAQVAGNVAEDMTLTWMRANQAASAQAQAERQPAEGADGKSPENGSAGSPREPLPPDAELVAWGYTGPIYRDRKTGRIIDRSTGSWGKIAGDDEYNDAISEFDRDLALHDAMSEPHLTHEQEVAVLEDRLARRLGVKTASGGDPYSLSAEFERAISAPGDSTLTKVVNVLSLAAYDRPDKDSRMVVREAAEAAEAERWAEIDGIENSSFGAIAWGGVDLAGGSKADKRLALYFGSLADSATMFAAPAGAPKGYGSKTSSRPTTGRPTLFGSIPEEHQFRYEIYLEGPRKGNLGPDEWYEVAQRAWANNKGGNSFEGQVRDAWGLPRGPGSKPVSIEGHVPDLPVGKRFGVTDVKDWIELNDSKQLRAFYKYAADNKLAFNLVISPRTNKISGPLLENVRATNGTVRQFDPVTKSFSTISIGPKGSGGWKRK